MAIAASSGSTVRPRVGFALLPFEGYREICSHLEPIWLWNLSHCWSVTFHSLSFEEGNLIWYEALPSHVLEAKERHQNERELVHMMQGQSNYVHAPGLVAVPMQNLAAKYVPDLLGFEIKDILTFYYSHGELYPAPSVLSAQASRLVPATVHNMLSAQYPRPASNTMNQLLPVRKRVIALGAGYEPFFNYKREIFGRIKSGQRCYICLYIIPNMPWSHITEWGLKWCPACFKKYTVGKLPTVI